MDLYRDQWWERTGLDSSEVRRILKNSGNIISFYDRITEQVCQREGAIRFVDKMPWPPRWYRLWYVTSKFRSAQWIHIVRDERDCYCSAQNHPHVPQSETVPSFAEYWRRCVLNHEEKIPDEQKYTVRYEDLTQRPTETMKSIMETIGLDFEQEQVKASSRSDYSEGAQGAHRRLQEPISDRSVGRWESELEDEDVALFRHHAGEMLRQFGYENASEEL